MRPTAPTNGFLDIPSSRPGRISAIAGGVVFVLAFLLPAIVSAFPDSDSLVPKLVFWTLGVVLAAACIVAMTAGALAVVRDRVRSFVTVFSILLGALMGWLLVIELFLGHE